MHSVLQIYKDMMETGAIKREATFPICAAPLSHFAHVIIDMQAAFCRNAKDAGTAETERAAQEIIRTAPAFNRLGIPTVWVYLDPYNEGVDHAYGGFYGTKVTEDRLNILFPKNATSAFDSTRLSFRDFLQKRGFTNLLVSGFNFSACVVDTVENAYIERYKTWMLMDCTGNERRMCHDGETTDHMRALCRWGITLTDSTKALAALAGPGL